MADDNLKNKVINATKWSSLTETIAKLINPLTNMILARILAPEAFGIVSTITMIISFTDIFTDAGVQKYLIQHEFEDEDDLNKHAFVAFWTNFVMSCLLWGIIAVYADEIALLVGNPGLGKVITIASIQLPITSFSGIQLSLFRRNFEFNKLFRIRVIEVFVPFFVTIPLAFLGMNYWALIIGTIISRLVSAILLTQISKWKPKFYFNFNLLKKMFNFSSWSLIESLAVWLTLWIDTLIVGRFLNNYYLGIYKTSTTMVNGLFGIFTASTVPIVLATLSRLQNDEIRFKNAYLTMQKYISILVLPIGVGIFLYSDLATSLFLGEQWGEASSVIGMWALSSALVIVLGQYCGDVYRSKGLPKLAFISQVLHLIFLIPVVYLSAQSSFITLVYVRSWSRLQSVLVNLIMMKIYMKIPISSTFKNILPASLSTILMIFVAVLLKQINEGIIWSLLSILMCGVIYLVTLLLLFKDTRKDLVKITETFFSKKRIE